MEGIPANYLGRLVSKENFRAFIYAPNGVKKLVNSWDEFEKEMASGLWFATIDEAQEPKVMAAKTRAKKTSSAND